MLQGLGEQGPAQVRSGSASESRNFIAALQFSVFIRKSLFSVFSLLLSLALVMFYFCLGRSKSLLRLLQIRRADLGCCFLCRWAARFLRWWEGGSAPLRHKLERARQTAHFSAARKLFRRSDSPPIALPGPPAEPETTVLAKLIEQNPCVRRRIFIHLFQYS